jgi:membrane protein implicated in regulation of membrane protease activity
MRRNRSQPVDLRPTYSPRQYLVAGLLCIAAIVTMVVAAAYPTAAVAGLLVAAAAVAARTLARRALTYRHQGDHARRQRAAESGRVCVPGTDICLDA